MSRRSVPPLNTSSAPRSPGDSDSGIGPNSTEPFGTYTLASVNGKKVPAEYIEPIVDKDFTIKGFITGGTIVLSLNGTYEFAAKAKIVATRIPFEKDVTVSLAGTVVSVPALEGGEETVTLIYSR